MLIYWNILVLNSKIRQDLVFIFQELFNIVSLKFE